MQNTQPRILLVLWLNFMIQVIPVCLASTCMELLIGILMSQGGLVTHALLRGPPVVPLQRGTDVGCKIVGFCVLKEKNGAFQEDAS